MAMLSSLARREARVRFGFKLACRAALRSSRRQSKNPRRSQGARRPSHSPGESGKSRIALTEQ
jgi:hypothetical protein